MILNKKTALEDGPRVNCTTGTTRLLIEETVVSQLYRIPAKLLAIACKKQTNMAKNSIVGFK